LDTLLPQKVLLDIAQVVQQADGVLQVVQAHPRLIQAVVQVVLAINFQAVVQVVLRLILVRQAQLPIAHSVLAQVVVLQAHQVHQLTRTVLLLIVLRARVLILQAQVQA